MKAMSDIQLALLKSGNFKARLLSDWYLNEGTFRFCDDVEDLTDGTNTWIGANALAAATDVKSGSGSGGFAAESITLTLDGTRMSEAGFSDPASIFQEILTYKLHQKRMNLWIGVCDPTATQISLAIPIYAGKINNVRVVDSKSQSPYDSGQAVSASPSNLIFTIDSLAARYRRVTGRTRSHADQQEIDASDLFFQFTVSMANATLYWGKVNVLTGANGFAARYQGPVVRSGVGYPGYAF